MTTQDTISGHPLTWPEGWPRTRTPRRSAFGNITIARASGDVLAELGRMDVGDWNVIISSNVELRLDGLPYSNRATPGDTGVAVWFKLKSEQLVLACDKWDRVEHNLRAIRKHIESIRGQERWGVGSVEQAFTAYKALPAPSANWWEILGVYETENNPDQIKTSFRLRVQERGQDANVTDLIAARDEGLQEAT